MAWRGGVGVSGVKLRWCGSAGVEASSACPPQTHFISAVHRVGLGCPTGSPSGCCSVLHVNIPYGPCCFDSLELYFVAP